LLRLYLEIRDIWRPGAGLAGTPDSMAQIRDIPGNLKHELQKAQAIYAPFDAF